MVPAWLETFSLLFVWLSILCAVWIAIDLLRRPQKMWIMDLVWPLTAFYTGPLGLAAYHAIGVRSARASAGGRKAPAGRHHGSAPAFAGGKPGRDGAAEADGGRSERARKPFWAAVLTGSMHCGAGCAVGDFVGEWLVFATGATILGSKLGANYAVAFVLAYMVGIFFQYFSIAPMRGLGLRDGLWAAMKADTLSLAAYEIGMFAWMAVTQKVLFPGLEPTSWTFWFMMQIAMVAGFFPSYPVNWWLVEIGVKERM